MVLQMRTRVHRHEAETADNETVQSTPLSAQGIMLRLAAIESDMQVLELVYLLSQVSLCQVSPLVTLDYLNDSITLQALLQANRPTSPNCRSIAMEAVSSVAKAAAMWSSSTGAQEECAFDPSTFVVCPILQEIL